MIAEVVFNLPLERSFHYAVPEPLRAGLQRGMRVLVPFGRRELMGWVVGLPARSPIKELKPLRRAVDPVPVIADERWVLAEWVSSYYYCSIGEALAAMVPSGLRLKFAAGSGLGAGGNCPQPSALSPEPTLTIHQQQGLRRIIEALDAGRPATLLVHGVSASGKTELYLQAIRHCLAQERAAICLVPEIALTPQTIERFRDRFGGLVAIWHSRLGARQRAAEWLRMARGECRVVVGPRSAVFAPLQRVGLIILDEEHETTYKQEDVPRYHARDVAQARARLAGAVVLLGSATPSVESFYQAARGRIGLITLPERVEGRPLPRVDLVDLREQWGARGRATPFSAVLRRALEQVVEQGDQAMLLLNRRGFARVAQCQGCGLTLRCDRCSVPLVYHAGRAELVCHYCSRREPLPAVCPACRKGYLRLRGMGTERVESELHRLFPVARIARMDLDTTRRRESHRELYEAVKTEQVGVLVGTQMIAKGLDFPQVTLVGVVSAATALNLPDFRAGERTFDLLTQMAGRAGRGARPGRVVIQTYCPGHYAIQAAARHDYGGFYAEEIRMRRRVGLPPFTHLVELTVKGTSRERAQAAADALGAALLVRQRSVAGRAGITLLGPAPHRIPRLRKTHRVCLILKGASAAPLVALLRRTLQPGRRFKGMPVVVDVDPL
ncbi:MAG: primosomal protein N' [Candidatus Omnitrophica bacterium]|nr:primosomal protein N' [Candidatus Omnitrophota bacterium]